MNKQLASGTIEAVSEQNALDTLYQSGFKYVLELEVQRQRPTWHKLVPSILGVKTPDVIEFSRQLAAFLESGSSLRTSMDLLKEQSSKPAMKDLIADLTERIEQGDSFSEAVRAHQGIFPHSYQEVIQSCEKTGELEKGLTQIARYMENRAQILDKVRRALAYPAFVVLLAIGVTILMVTTVLPSILKLFESYQAELPPITHILLSVVEFIIQYKFPLIGMIVGLPLAIFLACRTRFFKNLVDRSLLRLPVIGNLIIDHNLGLFCRSAAMLLKAGLPLPNIIEISVRNTSGNHLIQKSFSELKNHLMQGEGLAGPMSRDRLFPPMMVKMIRVGEHTGTLDNSMETLANYYQEHTSKRISTLIAMIEPGLTVIIGIGIAFLMLSMIIPIYQIMSKAG